MARRAPSAAQTKKKAAHPKKKAAHPKKKAAHPKKEGGATDEVASGGRLSTAAGKMADLLESRLIRSLNEQMNEMQTFVDKEQVAVEELRENIKDSFTRIDAILGVCPEHMSMNELRQEADATRSRINTILSSCPADAIITRSRAAERGIIPPANATVPDS